MGHYIKAIGLAAAFYGLAGGIACDPAAAQTLREAMVLAYESNPELIAARAGMRATAESIPQAQANIWRPQVSVNLSGSHLKESTKTFDRSTAGTSLSKVSDSGEQTVIGYEVQLPLYDRAAISAVDQARANTRQAISTLIQTEQSIMAQVAAAYAAVLRYREQVRLNTDLAADLNRVLDQSEDMLAAQRRTVTDVAAVREAWLSARSGATQARGELEAAESRFRVLTGSPPGQLEDGPAFADLPQRVEDATATALAGNPDIAAAKHQIEAGEAAVSGAYGGALPTVSLVHDFNRTKDNLSGTDSGFKFHESETDNEWSIGLSINIPLYAGGKTEANVRQAKQELSRSMSTLFAKTRSVEQSVRAAWSRLAATRENLRLSEDRVGAATTAEQGYAYLLQNGQITMQTFLNAKSTRIQAELSRIANREALLSQSAALLQAMGLLTATAQNLPVEHFDAETALHRADGRWFGYSD